MQNVVFASFPMIPTFTVLASQTKVIFILNSPKSPIDEYRVLECSCRVPHIEEAMYFWSGYGPKSHKRRCIQSPWLHHMVWIAIHAQLSAIESFSLQNCGLAHSRGYVVEVIEQSKPTCIQLWARTLEFSMHIHHAKHSRGNVLLIWLWSKIIQKKMHSIALITPHDLNCNSCPTFYNWISFSTELRFGIFKG